MAGIPSIQPYSFPSSASLPRNTVSWHVEPSRALLLIHDMQSYFLSPLPPAMREALTSNIASLLFRCRRAGIPIAYTAQPGRMSDQDRGLLRDFWGPGMQTTSVDREIAATISPLSDDWVFTKWRYSAFFRSDLRERMQQSGRDQLVLCGVYAHIGVLISAVEAFTHDIQPFVIADGVADFSENHHRQAMEYVAQCCGKVLTAQEVLA